MRTNYVLIDYENRQPTDLALLSGGDFRVIVFLGPNQTRIDVDFAAAMQALGTNAEYVRLETAGPNALDFHIAYYIGVWSTRDPTGYFHVISRDTGFDPLIKHLKLRKILAHRCTTIAELPFLRPSLPGSLEARVVVAVQNLASRKAAKPRTEKTLRSTLHSLFKKELSDEQLDELFAALRKRGVVRLDGTKVSYELPES